MAVVSLCYAGEGHAQDLDTRWCSHGGGVPCAMWVRAMRRISTRGGVHVAVVSPVPCR